MGSKQLVILSLLAVLFSCTNDSKSDRHTTDVPQVVTVTLDDAHSVDAGAVIEKIDILKLGPTGTLPIGEVRQLLVTDERIIAVDRFLAQAIFIFDRSGRCTGIIHRPGKGPQEYTEITHAALSHDGERIDILDSPGRRILSYDLTGKFIETQKTPFAIRSIEYTDADRAVCATLGPGRLDLQETEEASSDRLLFVTDSKFHILKSFFPCRYDSDLYGSVTPRLTKSGKTVHAIPSYCDTIYRIAPEGIEAKYRLDMTKIDGVANLPPDMTTEKLERLSKSHTLFDGSYVESEDFALFQVSTPPRRIIDTYFHTKRSGMTYRLAMPSDDIELFTRMHLTVAITCDGKNRFIAAVPAFRLLATTPPRWRELHPEFIEGLSEDSNPVLIGYTLREPGPR